MKTLLRIDCSARIKGSHSRSLADHFEERWSNSNPEGTIIYRDLVKIQLPHIQNDTIEGFYTPDDLVTTETIKATALSDELIKELHAVDEILISSPLYNLNIPSNLKAYLDQVVRIRHTFMITEMGYQGLLKDKIANIIMVKGGNYKGTPMEKYDFQEPYLKAILGHMGITNQTIFSLEGTSDTTTLEHKKSNIRMLIDEYFTL